MNEGREIDQIYPGPCYGRFGLCSKYNGKSLENLSKRMVCSSLCLKEFTLLLGQRPDFSPPMVPHGLNPVMKFLAKIVEAACLNPFTRISFTVAKLAKLVPCPWAHISSILSVAGGRTSMCCELPQGNVREFQRDGVSKENN